MFITCSMKAKRFCVQRFGEKIGMLLCRPYVVILNSPLATRSRHLGREEYIGTSAYNCCTRDRPPVISLPCTVRTHVWKNSNWTPLPAMKDLRRATEHSQCPPLLDRRPSIHRMVESKMLDTMIILYSPENALLIKNQHPTLKSKSTKEKTTVI